MTRQLLYGEQVTGALLTELMATGQNLYVYSFYVLIFVLLLNFIISDYIYVLLVFLFQLGSTFFRRLGWSPCGHFITTTHGFQKPRHSAPVLERGEWSATFDFLGHNAPVIVVKFNHSMFRRNLTNANEMKAVPVGWTNGGSKIGGKESPSYNVIAIGSQDRTITVWTTASPRPLFVAKHFFTQSVVDLSWYESEHIPIPYSCFHFVWVWFYYAFICNY